MIKAFKKLSINASIEREKVSNTSKIHSSDYMLACARAQLMLGFAFTYFRFTFGLGFTKSSFSCFSSSASPTVNACFLALSSLTASDSDLVNM